MAAFTAFLLLCKLLTCQTEDKAILKHYLSASFVNGKMEVNDNVGDPNYVAVLSVPHPFCPCLEIM